MSSTLTRAELLALLGDPDPSMRAQGVRKLHQDHLADPEIIHAVLERCFDDEYVVMDTAPSEHFTMQFKVVGDGEDFELGDRLPAAGDPIYSLVFLRLEDLELPGTAGTLRLFAKLLEERPFWPADLAGVVGAVSWGDDATAMRALAPPIVRRGAGDRLLAGRSAEGLEVLCEVAWSYPRSTAFLEALLRDDSARVVLLDVLDPMIGGEELIVDTGLFGWLHRAAARGSMDRAHNLFRRLLHHHPVSAGFAALTDPGAAVSFQTWLASKPVGIEDDLKALADALARTGTIPEGFPFVSLVERLDGPQACALIRTLDAYRDEAVHPTLRTHLLAWMMGTETAELGWEAWGLLLRGGAHNDQENLVHHGMSRLERGTLDELPPRLEETLVDIVRADPPVTDALPRLFGVALRYPDRVESFIGPLEAALDAGLEGDLRAFLKLYVLRCAKADPVERQESAGTYWIREGYRPEALRSLFSRLDSVDELRAAWLEQLPRPSDQGEPEA